MHKYLYIGLLLTLTHCIQGECPKECEETQTLYNDLKCKPIYEKPTDCCPKKYDCSHIDNAPKDKCLVKGKTYAVGEKVPNEEIYRNCLVGCSCNQHKNFTCAVLDCPEWLGVHPEFQCHFKYDLNKCCSVGQVCPPYDEDAKCKVGEETYLEGQRFRSPVDKCSACVCQKGFKGEFVEPFCAKASCSEEIRNGDDIKKYCAPVYLPNQCCPWEWLCPSDDDKIVAGPKTKQSPDLQCKYGSKILGIGDTFEKNGAKCECSVPPLVTCRRTTYD